MADRRGRKRFVAAVPIDVCAQEQRLGVLAKIESADSVSHLEEILDAVDGAMVARGDLGAELPVEEVGCQLATRYPWYCHRA